MLTSQLNPSALPYWKLTHLTLLKLSGPRVLEFLQGQLTCDVRRVTEHQMQPGFLCNLKGRIIAMMDVLMIEGHYHLMLASELLPLVEQDLRVVAQLSRVRWEAVQPVRILGLTAVHVDALNLAQPRERFECIPQSGAVMVAVADGLYLHLDWSIDPPSLPNSWPFMDDRASWTRQELFHELRVIHPQTSGMFLPHELELAQAPWVSYEKGCYKGQEILARMHFLGQSKSIYRTRRRLRPSDPSATAPQTYHPGAPLKVNQTVLGIVVEYCKDDQDFDLLSATIQAQHENIFNEI
jgi:folate-binding protein YgfZ